MEYATLNGNKMHDYTIQILVKKGSKRLAKKNLKRFANTSLLDIAINKALKVLPKNQVYLNTNCPEAIELAQQYEINIYQRDEALCADEITLDTISADFVKNNPCENFILVNTVVPNLAASVLEQMIKVYEEKKLKAIVSANEFKLHSFKNGKAINFENTSVIPMTQNIDPIQVCNWGFGIWNTESFLESFSKGKNAILSDDINFYPTDILAATKISTLEDFEMAQRFYLLNNPSIS